MHPFEKIKNKLCASPWVNCKNDDFDFRAGKMKMTFFDLRKDHLIEIIKVTNSHRFIDFRVVPKQNYILFFEDENLKKIHQQ
jgi:hypothetical protein